MRLLCIAWEHYLRAKVNQTLMSLMLGLILQCFEFWAISAHYCVKNCGNIEYARYKLVSSCRCFPMLQNASTNWWLYWMKNVTKETFWFACVSFQLIGKMNLFMWFPDFDKKRSWCRSYFTLKRVSVTLFMDVWPPMLSVVVLLELTRVASKMKKSEFFVKTRELFHMFEELPTSIRICLPFVWSKNPVICKILRTS